MQCSTHKSNTVEAAAHQHAQKYFSLCNQLSTCNQFLQQTDEVNHKWCSLLCWIKIDTLFRSYIYPQCCCCASLHLCIYAYGAPAYEAPAFAAQACAQLSWQNIDPKHDQILAYDTHLVTYAPDTRAFPCKSHT